MKIVDRLRHVVSRKKDDVFQIKHSPNERVIGSGLGMQKKVVHPAGRRVDYTNRMGAGRRSAFSVLNKLICNGKKRGFLPQLTRILRAVSSLNCWQRRDVTGQKRRKGESHEATRISFLERKFKR